jgi:uncharacterized protein YigE (DUF2233 family)
MGSMVFILFHLTKNGLQNQLEQIVLLLHRLYCYNKLMKKIIVGICLFFIVILCFYFAYSSLRQAVRKLASPIPSLPPLPTESASTKTPAQELTFDGKTYQFHFHKILPNETLILIPNFENASFSAQIVKQNNCTFGINGGFYKKEGGPLGLFQIGDKKIGLQIPSTTFNGFLTFCHSCEGKNLDSNLFISSTPFYPAYSPYPASFFVLQTGPLIFLKNKIQPNFVEEDFSRRSLIAKTVQGDFYLFSIFEKNNVLSGPRLKDLHDIFLTTDFARLADFELIMNLDGGSASAFYDKNLQVEEFKPIGSFLCGK